MKDPGLQTGDWPPRVEREDDGTRVLLTTTPVEETRRGFLARPGDMFHQRDVARRLLQWSDAQTEQTTLTLAVELAVAEWQTWWQLTDEYGTAALGMLWRSVVALSLCRFQDRISGKPAVPVCRPVLGTRTTMQWGAQILLLDEGFLLAGAPPILSTRRWISDKGVAE